MKKNMEYNERQKKKADKKGAKTGERQTTKVRFKYGGRFDMGAKGKDDCIK